MKKPARQMVVDEAVDRAERLSWRGWKTSDKVIAETRRTLLQARRVVLSDAASAKLGEIVAATERLMVRHQQFAIPPYDKTYVEFNLDAMYAAMGRRRTSPDAADRDGQMGLLFDGPVMHVYVRTLSGFTFPGLLRYYMRPPEDDGSFGPRHGERAEDGRIVCSYQESGIPLLDGNTDDALFIRAALLLGSTASELDPHEWVDIVHRWTPYAAYNTKEPYDAQSLMSVAGEVRNAVAVLLLLNCPEHYKLVAQPHRRFLNRGRPVVYRAHSVVELELGRRRDYARLWKTYSDRASPRRHEVRGHFRHRDGREDCAHEWPLVPVPSSTPVPGRPPAPTWTCSRCGRHRTWVAEHQRGDAGRGFVTKEYAVGKEGEKTR